MPRRRGVAEGLRVLVGIGLAIAHCRDRRTNVQSRLASSLKPKSIFVIMEQCVSHVLKETSVSISTKTEKLVSSTLP